VEVGSPQQQFKQDDALFKEREDLAPGFEGLGGLQAAVGQFGSVREWLHCNVHLHHCLLRVQLLAVDPELGLLLRLELEVATGISTLDNLRCTKVRRGTLALSSNWKSLIQL
jgi:hypothetical protein